MRMYRLKVSNSTCDIAIYSVLLNNAHSVYDLNTSSSHCIGNVNNPAYFSVDSGHISVNLQTSNVTQDGINVLSYDSPELLNDSYQSSKELRRKNINRIIFLYLNINGVRNKIYLLAAFIKNNIDICLISETKINKTFPGPIFN